MRTWQIMRERLSQPISYSDLLDTATDWKNLATQNPVLVHIHRNNSQTQIFQEP